MASKELLKRIDERNYLTEREHREFLDRLSKDLEEKELLETELKLEKDKVKYVMKQLKKQDKILEILKKCEDEKHSLYYVYVLNALSSGKITQDECKLIKEVLDNGKN